MGYIVFFHYLCSRYDHRKTVANVEVIGKKGMKYEYEYVTRQN